MQRLHLVEAGGVHVEDQGVASRLLHLAAQLAHRKFDSFKLDLVRGRKRRAGLSQQGAVAGDQQDALEVLLVGHGI
jgi:hypothetical protein